MPSEPTVYYASFPFHHERNEVYSTVGSDDDMKVVSR